MNKVNFESGSKFPMYREALQMMQDSTLLAATLALLGGENYILSGCENNGDGTISDGYIVVAGELMPFRGGASGTRITVTETRQPVDAFGITYPEVYIIRYAQFSGTGEHLWADFTRVSSNTQLYKLIKDIQGDAPGTVKMWAGLASRIPSDYRLCDGAELAVSEYPELFQNIGNVFGGDGQAAFRLPDLRGKFIAGYNAITGTDYERIGQTGGAAEVALTSVQLPAHNHTSSAFFNKLAARASDIDSQNTPSGLDAITGAEEYRVGGMSALQWADATIQSVGENKPHENRPPFFVLAYIIKVR